MDEIFKTGRARERRMEIFLGVVLLAGGLGLYFGMAALTNGGYTLLSIGTLGIGAVLLGDGLLRS